LQSNVISDKKEFLDRIKLKTVIEND